MLGSRINLQKAGIAGGGALLAFVAMTNALANYLASRQPSFALALWPSHTQALQLRSDQLLLGNRSGFQLRASQANARLSRRALESAAIAPGAVRTAALLATQSGDRPRGRRLLLAANRLTRRDYVTQFLLMEDRVRQRDIDGVLDALSPALMTSLVARRQLVPVFARLISTDAMIPPLRRFIKSRPNWLLPMLSSSISQSPDPRPLARAIVAERGLSGSGLEISVTQQLAYRLASLGYVDLANDVVATMPAQSRPLLSTLAVSSLRDDAFAWTFLPSVEFTGQVNNGGRWLDFDIGAPQADLARKLVVSDGGAVAASVIIDLDALEADTLPTVEIVQDCARGGNSRLLLHRRLHNGRQVSTINGDPTLACNVQIVTIRVLGVARERRYNLRIRFQ